MLPDAYSEFKNETKNTVFIFIFIFEKQKQKTAYRTGPFRMCLVKNFTKLFLKTKNNFLKVITKKLKTTFYCFLLFSKQVFKINHNFSLQTTISLILKTTTKHFYIVFRFKKLLLKNTTKHITFLKTSFLKHDFHF